MKAKYYIYEMNLAILTVISFLLLFLAMIPCFLLEIEMNEKILMESCILMIPWLILHELIHSISYLLNGAKWKNITYGMCLEKSILYCLCKQNITKKNILCSLLSPLLIIGMFTYLIGIWCHSTILIFLSILNISGCSGDIMMFLFISKLKNVEFSEFDNPTSFALYTTEDLENKHPFGLTLKETTETIKRSDFKKVQISKASIWILIGLFLLFAVSCIINCI